MSCARHANSTRSGSGALILLVFPPFEPGRSCSEMRRPSWATLRLCVNRVKGPDFGACYNLTFARKSPEGS